MDIYTAAMIMDGEWELVGVEACEDNYIEACQTLIDSGAAWQLQGRIGRTCMQMIEEGHCTMPQND